MTRTTISVSWAETRRRTPRRRSGGWSRGQAPVAQSAEAADSKSAQCAFESHRGHHEPDRAVRRALPAPPRTPCPPAARHAQRRDRERSSARCGTTAAPLGLPRRLAPRHPQRPARSAARSPAPRSARGAAQTHGHRCACGRGPALGTSPDEGPAMRPSRAGAAARWCCSRARPTLGDVRWAVRLATVTVNRLGIRVVQAYHGDLRGSRHSSPVRRPTSGLLLPRPPTCTPYVTILARRSVTRWSRVAEDTRAVPLPTRLKAD